MKNKEEKWEARKEENRHCSHKEYFALCVAGRYYVVVKPLSWSKENQQLGVMS